MHTIPGRLCVAAVIVILVVMIPAAWIAAAIGVQVGQIVEGRYVVVDRLGPAFAQDPIHVGDSIQVGAEGQAAISFVDGNTLVLGPDSWALVQPKPESGAQEDSGFYVSIREGSYTWLTPQSSGEGGAPAAEESKRSGRDRIGDEPDEQTPSEDQANTSSGRGGDTGLPEDDTENDGTDDDLGNEDDPAGEGDGDGNGYGGLDRADADDIEKVAGYEGAENNPNPIFNETNFYETMMRQAGRIEEAALVPVTEPVNFHLPYRYTATLDQVVAPPEVEDVELLPDHRGAIGAYEGSSVKEPGAVSGASEPDQDLGQDFGKKSLDPGSELASPVKVDPGLDKPVVDTGELTRMQTREITGAQTKDLVRSQTQDLMKSQTKDLVRSQTQDLIKSQTQDLVRSQTRELIQSQTKEQVQSQTQELLRSESRELLQFQVHQ